MVREVDAAWERARGRGTRAADGRPGAGHWTQGARYVLSATFDPRNRRLRGSGTLRYLNRSPDTLTRVALQLSQNLFAKNAPSREQVPVTGGLSIETLCVSRLRGAAARALCAPTPGRDTSALQSDFTVGWVTLPAPLLPGDSVDLLAAWSFVLPGRGAPRMGSDGVVHMAGYWYPQFAVYDDVVGWQVDPYLATGEFYMDQASYDVRITVPTGMLVAATGTLQNPEAVLTPTQRERLQRAARSFQPVAIVARDEPRGSGTPSQTWHYVSEGTRDFAFYMSRDVVWDAMAALVPRGRAQDTVLIHALYPPSRKAWRRAADYGRIAIEEFSRRFWPYPWPQMTVVEGIVEGGMEYPMLTIITAATADELFGTTAHEVAHMWFPMQVGSDERRYAWMDEGMADWMQAQAERAQSTTKEDGADLPDAYAMLAGRSDEGMLVPADGYSSLYSYVMASYDKLSVVFRAYSAQYGDSALMAGVRAYGLAWRGKHPYPADFYRMVFAAAGDERDVFVDEWIRGTGTLDASVSLVNRQRDSVTVRVTSSGGAHTAIPVTIVRDGEPPERRVISARAFRENPVQEFRIGRIRHLQRVTLDADGITPDRVRQNNVALP
jgi:hypothetical protein